MHCVRRAARVFSVSALARPSLPVLPYDPTEQGDPLHTETPAERERVQGCARRFAYYGIHALRPTCPATSSRNIILQAAVLCSWLLINDMQPKEEGGWRLRELAVSLRKNPKPMDWPVLLAKVPAGHGEQGASDGHVAPAPRHTAQLSTLAPSSCHARTM
jgi:hypothetical protein